MKRWIKAVVMFLGRLLLRLRYRVEVLGLEKIRDLKGPTMVFPNHPAYVDPPLVLTHIRPGRTLRPLVYSGSYRNPGLYPLMLMVDALEVPDLKQHSRDSHTETLQLIDSVLAGLDEGHAFLLYPSGRLQRGEREVIGGSRAAYEIVTRSENCNIVLVRTRGVWGSNFSCAENGQLPGLGGVLLRGFLWGIVSLFLFAPKRRITMTVELMDRAKLPMDDRAKFNRFLEDWYNQDGGEAPQFVPFHAVMGPKTKEYHFAQGVSLEDIDSVPAKIRSEVNEMVEAHLKRPLTEAELNPEKTLDAIGLDSLERMELSLELENRYGFRADQVPEVLGQLWLLAHGSYGGGHEAQPVPPQWESPSPQGVATLEGRTIAEAFVNRAKKSPKDIAVADEMSGVLTYRRVLVGAELMARRFRKLSGESVGLMLPASVAADLSFLGLHLANKIPVVLNWTTGPAALNHAVKTLDVQCVITSKRFVDRLGIAIEGVEYIYLEDIRATIGKAEKIATLLKAIFSSSSFVPTGVDPQRAAAVLFTSGSESAPKAVPLSHHNLLTNVTEAVAALGFQRSDSLLGFLPPFHSFGLTGNMLFCLLAGVRLVHYPDPTNARALAGMIGSYRPTLLFATPTFLSYILGVADDADLQSLRFVVMGAERCPDAVRADCERRLPQITILEGYGITECSPVVSTNSAKRNKPGSIGIPIAGMETVIVHPETRSPLPQGEAGLLLVRGESVFSGYLQYDGPQPFVEHDEKRWYNTGDLVRQDEEGFLFFEGRLKRFIKSAGEMISLPALEQPFQAKYPPTEEGPRVAVEGIETESGGRCVVLFTTQPTTLAEANGLLKASGFRGVMRLDEVQSIDSIPVLGTGKVDYKVLRQNIHDRLVADGVQP